MPKEQGGLGIKDLRTVNQCLLLKHLHRLHHPGESAWANWMHNNINVASLEGACEGTHWKTLRDLLPVYRAITTTSIGNGLNTSFWHDNWLPSGPLAETFPALFSHAKEPNASVGKVCSEPLRSHFVHRLS